MEGEREPLGYGERNYGFLIPSTFNRFAASESLENFEKQLIHSYGVYGTRKNGPNHCFAFYI